LVAPKKDRLRRRRLPTARVLRVECGELGTFPSMAACRTIPQSSWARKGVTALLSRTLILLY
jgi:hypothetical protein